MAYRRDRVDNARLRAVMGLDTLAASQLLRGLRDRDLLTLHSHGAASNYTLSPALRESIGGSSDADRGELDDPIDTTSERIDTTSVRIPTISITCSGDFDHRFRRIPITMVKRRSGAVLEGRVQGEGVQGLEGCSSRDGVRRGVPEAGFREGWR